jgi:hypothetical protein
LIVESEIGFGPQLEEALQTEGAETVIVRDPYSNHGARSVSRFVVCAAVINNQHRSVAKALSVPVLIYGHDVPVPARTATIVRELKHMLSQE